MMINFRNCWSRAIVKYPRPNHSDPLKSKDDVRSIKEIRLTPVTISLRTLSIDSENKVLGNRAWAPPDSWTTHLNRIVITNIQDIAKSIKTFLSLLMPEVARPAQRTVHSSRSQFRKKALNRTIQTRLTTKSDNFTIILTW